MRVRVLLDRVAEQLEVRGELELAAELDSIDIDIEDIKTGNEIEEQLDQEYALGPEEIGTSNFEGWKDQWPHAGDLEPKKIIEE